MEALSTNYREDKRITKFVAILEWSVCTGSSHKIKREFSLVKYQNLDLATHLRSYVPLSFTAEFLTFSRHLYGLWLRACLHRGGGPQIGEVTGGGSPHLSCKRDQSTVKWDIIWTGGLPHPSGLPHLPGPPPPCKQALRVKTGQQQLSREEWRNLVEPQCATLHEEDEWLRLVSNVMLMPCQTQSTELCST